MSLRGLPALLRYVVILSREIVLASISVTKLVFGPTEKLRSGFVAYTMEAETDLEVTTLANSITLTPGTISLELDDDTIIVRALTRDGAASLEGGDMDRRVTRLEQAS